MSSSMLSSIFNKQPAPPLLRSISSYSNKPTRSSMSYFSFIWKILLPTLTLLWIAVILFSHSTSASSYRKEQGSGSGSGSAAGLRGSIKSFSDIIIQKTPSLSINGNSISNSNNNHDLRSFPNLDHVVIVTGHAVMRLSKMKEAPTEDSAWYLLPYQRDQNFPAIISSHVQTGIALTLADPNAVLVFSGGQTRRDTGPISEAASYYYLSESQSWLAPDLVDRTVLEEHARDSFENLLFSICRFREVTSRYPKKITIVGFDFKAQRFTNIHRRAISFPDSNFSYVGLEPTGKFDRARAAAGEAEVLKSFGKDIYGCSDPSLSAKRDLRNPFRRTIPYELSCPELKGMFNWCGPEIYAGDLPWNGDATTIASSSSSSSNSNTNTNTNSNNDGTSGDLDKLEGRGGVADQNHRDFKDPTWASIKE